MAVAVLQRDSDRRVLQVIDEAWAAVRHGARHFQGSLKLSRTYGVSTCWSATGPPTSPPSPTTAPPTPRSPPGCCPTSRPGSSSANRPTRSPSPANCSASPNAKPTWVGQLVRGRALWRLQNRGLVVQTVLTAAEMRVFDTDQAMS